MTGKAIIQAYDKDGNKVEFTNEHSKKEEHSMEVQFNPTDYSLSKNVKHGKHDQRGSTTDGKQKGSSDKATLSMNLLFDTYEDIVDGGDDRVDVRKKYVNWLLNFTEIYGDSHDVPVCRVTWGESLDFSGVLGSLKTQFTMFHHTGTPVRAKVDVTLEEFERPTDPNKETNLQSADKTKVWRVTEGDTLWLIAATEYKDPRKWRPIAQENGIEDPRSLQAGRELRIPALTS